MVFMMILIQEPGAVCVCQSGLQSYPNVYEHSSTRYSNVDGATMVLDVRFPIVAPNITIPGGYRIVEGHTRFYEAARRNIGVDAVLIENVDDLLRCPPECFVNLPFARCEEIFKRLDFYQQTAHEYGKYYVHDLL